MDCDCFERHMGLFTLSLAGVLAALGLMVLGLPIFHPRLVLFPLPWVLGIFTLLVSLMVPFYLMRLLGDKAPSEGKSRQA